MGKISGPGNRLWRDLLYNSARFSAAPKPDPVDIEMKAVIMMIKHFGHLKVRQVEQLRDSLLLQPAAKLPSSKQKSSQPIETYRETNLGLLLRLGEL